MVNILILNIPQSPSSSPSQKPSTPSPQTSQPHKNNYYSNLKLFDIYGINPTSSKREVIVTYRKLARAYHQEKKKVKI